MRGCVFCEILAAGRPASMVYEDDLCGAFLDIAPINPGHVLVVPLRHAEGLAELDDRSGARMFAVGRRVALALRRGALSVEGVRCEGINLYLADGAAAGQVVHHVHLHVVPRYFGDGSGFRFGPPDRRVPSRAELDALAAALCTAVCDGSDKQTRRAPVP